MGPSHILQLLGSPSPLSNCVRSLHVVFLDDHSVSGSQQELPGSRRMSSYTGADSSEYSSIRLMPLEG
jgi:hypothetical protein